MVNVIKSWIRKYMKNNKSGNYRIKTRESRMQETEVSNHQINEVTN